MQARKLVIVMYSSFIIYIYIYIYAHTHAHTLARIYIYIYTICMKICLHMRDCVINSEAKEAVNISLRNNNQFVAFACSIVDFHIHNI